MFRPPNSNDSPTAPPSNVANIQPQLPIRPPMGLTPPGQPSPMPSTSIAPPGQPPPPPTSATANLPPAVIAPPGIPPQVQQI